MLQLSKTGTGLTPVFPHILLTSYHQNGDLAYITMLNLKCQLVIISYDFISCCFSYTLAVRIT